MVRFKVNTPDDSREFITTSAYSKLHTLLKQLKTRRGRIVHVIGAPGTGKSANIYKAVDKLELNVYEPTLILDKVDVSSMMVYHEFFHTLNENLNVKSSDELFKKVAEYDAILLADKFHDSHLLYENKVGFSQWMNNAGLKSFLFYFLLVLYYFRYITRFRGINLIFQTAWTIRFGGVKQDLFTDFGLFSRALILVLRIFFDVVEVSYTESEIMEIVKKHLPEAGEDEIKFYIKKYGSNIRSILEALKEGHDNQQRPDL